MTRIRRSHLFVDFGAMVARDEERSIVFQSVAAHVNYEICAITESLERFACNLGRSFRAHRGKAPFSK